MLPRTLSGFAVLAFGFLSFELTAAPEAGWQANDFPMPTSPVNLEASVVEGDTEIKWMPEAFEFTPGASQRYVDFEAGDDANAGDSREAAWKHHPWDPQAGGRSAEEQGAHTYVFKGGVIYRGNLVSDESGTEAEPIRLTRDPSWGAGPATLAGSMVPTGWKQASDEEATAAGIPESSRGKVWVTTLPGEFVPRAGWVLKPDGSRGRVNLARWPNWKAEHPYNHFTQWFGWKKSWPDFPAPTSSRRRRSTTPIRRLTTAPPSGWSIRIRTAHSRSPGFFHRRCRVTIRRQVS